MTRSPAADATPAIPTATWVLGFSYLAAQVVALVAQGPQDADDWLLSIPLGVVITTFFAHGVLRARAIRFWCVVVLTLLGLILGTIGSINAVAGQGDGDGLLSLVHLVLGGVQVVALHGHYRSRWFDWQRTRPRGGASILPLMLIAVAVGVVGGVVGTNSEAFGATIDV